MKRAAILVAALVVGAGCSLGDTFADNGTVRADPAERELVGVWAGYSSAARYELRADHTFVATAVPAAQLSGEPGSAGPFHGDGTWGFEPATIDAQDVVLRYQHVLDPHDIPVPGSYYLHATPANETVSPDHQLILSLADDYLTKA